MKTVILAAGFGSRLWPLSTPERPKQFQALLGEQSLLQYTYDMMAKVTPARELYVLTLSGFEDIVRDQIPGIVDGNIIAVPERRNTLPHTLYALRIITQADDEPVLFAPVDHYLHSEAAFLSSLQQEVGVYEASDTITILCCDSGGYDGNAGYLVTDLSGQILAYREKPSQGEVRQLQGRGTLYKDTALYITSRSGITRAIKDVDSQTAEPIAAFMQARGQALLASYVAMPFMDIPTKLFEYATNLQVAHITAEFTDVGRYAALHAILPKDDRGNAIVGDVILGEACTGSLAINTTDRPLVVMAGDAQVVVRTPGGSLQAPLADADKIGDIYKAQIYIQR